MRSENIIELKMMIRAIQRVYGLEITQIEFMLRGFGRDLVGFGELPEMILLKLAKQVNILHAR